MKISNKLRNQILDAISSAALEMAAEKIDGFDGMAEPYFGRDKDALNLINAVESRISRKVNTILVSPGQSQGGREQMTTINDNDIAAEATTAAQDVPDDQVDAALKWCDAYSETLRLRGQAEHCYATKTEVYSLQWMRCDNLPEMSDVDIDHILAKSEVRNGERWFPFIDIYSDSDGSINRIFIGA